MADNVLLAQVFTEKFEQHTSLTRQEAKFVRQGVGISRQVMVDWLEGCAKAIKHSPPKNKRAVRQKESLPIVQDKIRPWFENNLKEYLPQSPMRKGIEYALGIWQQLNVYLQDG